MLVERKRAREREIEWMYKDGWMEILLNKAYNIIIIIINTPTYTY